MSRGSETVVIDEWLETVLADITDVTGVFNELAPTEQLYPFIVYQLQSPSDVVGLGPQARIMVDAEYVVRVVAAVGSFADIAEIANEIDAAIDGQGGPTSTGVVLGTVRLAQYRQVEQFQNDQIHHLGGRYRIQAQGA